MNVCWYGADRIVDIGFALKTSDQFDCRTITRIISYYTRCVRFVIETRHIANMYQFPIFDSGFDLNWQYFYYYGWRVFRFCLNLDSLLFPFVWDFLLSNTAFFSLVQTQKRGKKHQVLHKQSFLETLQDNKNHKMLRPVKQCSSIFHAVIPFLPFHFFFSFLFCIIIIIMKFLKRIHSSLNANFTVSKHTHTHK